MAFSYLFLLSCLLLSFHFSVSENATAPLHAPVPSPEDYASPPLTLNVPVPAPSAGSPEGAVPAGAPVFSPPAPSPSDLKSPPPSATPDAAPALSPGLDDISHGDISATEGEEASGGGDGDGGMSGGKKAGIAVGVLAAACLVGLGGVVYKRRQDNIRRSQYGYAARREIL